MADTKFGLDQMDKPAPLWYRRFSNGMIMFIIPGGVGVVQGLTMSAASRNVLMLVLAFLPALLKGIGVMMGNGQYYTPSNETIDKDSKQ